MCVRSRVCACVRARVCMCMCAFPCAAVARLKLPCCAGSLRFACQRHYMKCAVSLNGTVLQCIQNGGNHQWQIRKAQVQNIREVSDSSQQ